MRGRPRAPVGVWLAGADAGVRILRGSGQPLGAPGSSAKPLEPAVSLPPQFGQSIGLLAIDIVDPSELKEASPEHFLPARRKSIIWQRELPGNQLEARAAEAIKLIDDVDHASHI